MYIHNLDPTILSVGPLEIRWYGLVYVLGFFLAVWWLHFLRKKNLLEISQDEILDLTFYLMLGVLIGSRLFMIFWAPEVYLYKPWNLFFIWQGGMSFHGGLVGIVTACYLYCRKKKINFWKIADAMSFPTLFALALGRLANFVNGELVGRVWNGSWCVVFPQYDQQCRHPNMIYSFIERMLISLWLGYLTLKIKLENGNQTKLLLSNNWINKIKRIFWPNNFYPGFIFLNFLLLEGLGRFLMDFFREDILYFGFSLGQWFSLVMVFAALIVMIKKSKNK
ncbi:prolipoprotein diacylglyceryl transferase [Candidatus Woesearchaeota archaeon]|nr:prolipoprotein diacylglyceryl transferase [Candidatus Woesearchaeota archaeon]